MAVCPRAQGPGERNKQNMKTTTDPGEHTAAAGEMSPQKLAILEVAQAMFVQRGYEGLSIRDLADACGLAKATIYHHFRDKEDLLFLVLEHQVHAQHAQLMAVAAGELPPQEKLRTAMQTYYQLLAEQRVGVMWSISAYSQLKEHLKVFLQAHMALALEPWIQILSEGREAGVFCALDAKKVAFSLLALLNSTLIYHIGLGIDTAAANPPDDVYHFVTRGMLQDFGSTNE
jgi:AcrR family transcriptional regulator